MSWDKDSVIQLIEAYKLKEILWNPQDRNYYNRSLKKDAWDELETELQRPSKEIKKKVDYLLSALRRERQKMAKSKTTGQGADNVYQSTWFAFAHLDFLLDKNKPRAGRLNTENEAEHITEDNDSIDNEHFEDESHESESQEPGTQASGGQKSATQLSGTQAPGGRASETQASGSQSSGNRAPGTRPNSAAFKSPVPRKQRKRAPQNDPIMNEALQLMRASSQAATSAVSADSTQPFSDRHQIYANYLESKFRSYTQTTFLAVEHRINEILYHADSGEYEWASGYGGSDVKNLCISSM